MKIGELARAASTPVETIRYYERVGILPPAARTDSNYRRYGPQDIERLAFVRHCRSLDMSLDEVRVLLRFRDDPSADCGEVNKLLEEHIGHVSARIRELRALEQQLRTLGEHCRTPAPSADCGILAGLARDARNPPEAGAGAGHLLGHVHGSHRHEGQQPNGIRDEPPPSAPQTDRTD